MAPPDEEIGLRIALAMGRDVLRRVAPIVLLVGTSARVTLSRWLAR